MVFKILMQITDDFYKSFLQKKTIINTLQFYSFSIVLKLKYTFAYKTSCITHLIFLVCKIIIIFKITRICMILSSLTNLFAASNPFIKFIAWTAENEILLFLLEIVAVVQAINFYKTILYSYKFGNIIINILQILMWNSW